MAKHTLSTDMLEGFEHTSTFASATNNGNSKRLEVHSELFYGGIVSTFRIVVNNEVVKTTEFLYEAIVKYNEI